MVTMTMGQIAFNETRNAWERDSKAVRRCTLRVIAEDEVHAESPFNHLPTSIREALIKDWERQHLEKKVRRRAHTCGNGLPEPCERCLEFKKVVEDRHP